MSSITPVPPPGPSGPSGPSPTVPLVLPFTGDNQSAYSSEIGKTMTIGQFSSSIISATNKLNETSWAVQQYNATSRKDIYNYLIENSLEMLAIYSEFLRIAGQFVGNAQANANNVNNVNSDTNAYNSQVAAINQAISDFNAGFITQAQFQAAIDTYNAYAALQNTQGSITSFNTNTQTINDNTDLLNQQLIAAGAPPLPTQVLYTGPNAVPLPQITESAPATPPTTITPISAPTLTSVPNTMGSGIGVDPVMIASFLFAPYFALMAGQFDITSDTVQQQSAYQGFLQFILGTIPYAPPAFYTPSPKIYVGAGADGTGGGSGVSLGSIVATLSNILMEGIIAKGIFTTNMAVFNQENSAQIPKQLQYLALSLLSHIGLQSGASAASKLGARLSVIDLNSAGVSATTGLSLAEEIAHAVSSGIVQDSLKKILANAYPSLSEEVLNSLAQQLATPAELFLLQAGLFQLSTALGLSDLHKQILSSLSSAQQFALTNPQPTVKDIIRDEVKRADIARNIARGSNVSIGAVEEAITAAFSDEVYNEKTLIQSLARSEVTQKAALNVAALVKSYTDSEIRGSGTLDQLAASNRLRQSTLGSELVDQIIQAQPEITNRQLRDRLAQQFTANGASQAQAIAAATTAVTGAGTSQIPADLATTLREKGLVSIAGLGLSPSESKAFADQLVSTVLGPNVPGSQTSLSALIDSRISSLTQAGDAKLGAKVQEGLTAFLEPTVNLYTFAERLRDPANTYLYSAQTGLMYAHPQPSNFIKSVDIPV